LAFALGLTRPAAAAISFTPSCFTNHPSIAEAAADFNEDGHMDVVLSNTTLSAGGSPILGSDLEVYLGNGDGTFGLPVRLNGQNSSGIVGLIAVDVDNDGHADLVAANGSGTISVFSGHGDGTFASMKNFGAGYSMTGVAAGDFNGDGRMDLVAGDGGKPRVAVLLGTGNGGGFKARVQYDVGFTVRGLTTADLNGDGHLDIITVNNAANSILGTTLSILLGNGDGTFRPFSLVTVPRFVGRRVFAVDFDQDGHPDLVVGSQDFGDSGVQTLHGRGDGTFDPAVYTVTSSNGTFVTTTLDVTVGDLNGDGHPDVVAGNVRYDSNQHPVARDLTLLLCQPGGSLIVDGNTPVHYARGLVVADFNGDGLQDIASDDCVQLQNAAAFATAAAALHSTGGGGLASPQLALSFAPNPWSDAGQVSFMLPRSSRVSLGLYDLNGRRVASLLNGAVLEAGDHRLALAHPPAGAGPGVYFYRLWTEGGSTSVRVVLTTR
jgi:hypothetical protein